MLTRLRTACLGALAAGAALVCLGTADSDAKLDRALRDWAHHPSAGSVRTLIRTSPGASAKVQARLAQLKAATVVGSVGTDLIGAELSSKALTTAASDRNVARLSSDAIVKSLGS